MEQAKDAVEFCERAMAHMENRNDPVAIIEGATAKLATGDVLGSLRDFSQVVSAHPSYPKLNAAIYRAASLLLHLGDRKQSAQYLAYCIDDPPVHIGVGELELRALLVICAEGVEGGDKDAIARLYDAMADSWSRTDSLPPNCALKPPNGVTFRAWGAPWRVLADRAFSRCDYITGIEFLLVFTKRIRSAEALVLLGEARFIMNQHARCYRVGREGREREREGPQMCVVYV